MTDTISLRAGARRIDISSSSRDAVKITGWDWGNPDTTPTIADGIDGGVRIGASDLEQSRTITIDVSTTYGNVPGFQGLAINRVQGREPLTGTGSTSLSWLADTSDLNPDVADLAAEVRSSTAGTVALAAVRGSTVVASQTFSIPAGDGWTRLEMPNVALPGTGALTLRVTFAVSGSFPVAARCPVLGTGLNCTYHDRYTPGARTPGNVDGRVIRWANGERWANECLAGLAEAVGAVALEGQPVLIRSGDAWTSSWTFNLHKAQVSAPQQDEHHMGHLNAKLAFTAAPDGRLDQITVAGALTSTTVGSMPVWRASTAIPGDLPAIAEVTATWADNRRDAIAATSPGQPIALLPSPLLSGWTTGLLSGAMGSAGVSGFTSRSLVPVAEFTAPTAGSFRFDALVNVTTGEAGIKTEPVALVIDGRSVETVAVEPFRDFMGAWRWARFGTYTVAAGSRVQVMMGSTSAIQAGVDILSLTPAGGTAADIKLTDEIVPGGTTVGDEFPDSGSGSLNGRTGVFGATWNAASWTWGNGYASVPSPGGTGYGGGITAEGDLASLAHVTLDTIVMWPDNSASPGSVTLQGASSTVRYVRLVRDASTGDLKALIGAGPGIATSRRIGNVGAGVKVRVIVQVDKDGHLVILVGYGGQTPRTAFRGHSPALVTRYRPDFTSGQNTSIRIYSLLFTTGTTLPYGPSIRWSAGQSGQPASGGSPRLEPGTRPYVFVRAAATAIDSPASPHPTAVTVKVTPRVLQVPR